MADEITINLGEQEQTVEPNENISNIIATSELATDKTIDNIKRLEELKQLLQ